MFGGAQDFRFNFGEEDEQENVQKVEEEDPQQANLRPSKVLKIADLVC